MSRFLIKTLVFILSLLVLLTVLFLITRKGIRENGNYKLGEGINAVILGHSAPACSFNDSLLPGIRNLSDPTEGYFYTYIKLRRLVSANPGLKYCFIEFTNNQVGEFANERIYGQYASHLLRKYLLHMDLREAGFFLSRNPLLLLKLVLPVMKENVWFLMKSDSPYLSHFKWGSYSPQSHVMTRHSLDSLEKAHNPGGNALVKYSYGVSKENIWALARTLRFLRERHIAVFFIRSPLLNANEQLSTEGAFQDIRRNEFSDVPFLDFNRLRLEPADFADLAHVNVRGAGKCSDLLARLVQKGLYTTSDPDSLMASCIVDLEKTGE